MKIAKPLLLAAAIAAALAIIPTEVANAYWQPGYGTWRHAYVYDPAYRWGTPAQRNYIRDLYLRGPGYAAWHQNLRYRPWW